MKIAVIGTGYVGLVSGTCFAEVGNTVTCVDIDEKKVQKLKSGEVTIYEPGLNTIFQRNAEEGRLHFTTSLSEGIEGAEIIMLALPTPPGADGFADLKYVLQVADDLSELITDYTVVVGKSTVPVGTAQKIKDILSAKLDASLFDVVSNPEFLREGIAVEDFMKPDRIVVGTESEKAQNYMKRLYSPFVKQGNPILFMDNRSAEMTKYAANSYLATRITFMNEIANLCDALGANVEKVRLGMGSDSRIGKRYLFPGIGYGGSCFPKDVQALHATAQSVDYHFGVLNAVMQVNQRQKKVLVDKIKTYYDNNLEGKTFAIWGLSFKPNTDDIREAPALEIIEQLIQEGAKVVAYDPEAMENVRALFGDRISFGTNQYDILEGADALVLCTEWRVFRTPSFSKIKSLLAEPVIFDGRNIFSPDEMKHAGFHYESIGRPSVES